jgi:cytochrome b561
LDAGKASSAGRSEFMVNPKPAYTGTAILLHWLVVALLVAQFAVAWTMPDIGRDTPQTILISLHFSLGVLILFVAVIRLLWRATHREPEPEAGVPRWQVRSAHAVHWLLYVLLIVLPIVGWINASWRGYSVTPFGLFELPKLVATHADGWGWTGDVHAALSNYLLLALVGLHVLAALYHQFIRRDAVLQRMLPWVRFAQDQR